MKFKLGSSINFADLRMPDAEKYMANLELAVRNFKIATIRRLTQAAAGKVRGITQLKMSAFLNGWLDGFSTNRLIRFLKRAGLRRMDQRLRVRTRGSKGGIECR